MKKEFNVVTGEELLNKPLREIEFVVENLIPKGLHLLAGAPKVGKSWLALWLSLMVSKGEDVWGNKVTQGTTLYLCFEDNEIRIQNRLFEITDDAPNSVCFCTEQAKLETDLEERIRNFVNGHSDTNLIIIDTLQTIRKANVDSSYSNDYSDLLPLKKLSYELNIAIILIHHLRKQKDNDKFNEISGSTGLQGVVDTMMFYLLMINEVRNQLCIVLVVTLRNVKLNWKEAKKIFGLKLTTASTILHFTFQIYSKPL